MVLKYEVRFLKCRVMTFQVAAFLIFYGPLFYIPLQMSEFFR